MTTGSAFPGERWMMAAVSSNVETGVPSTETMTSPGRMPAAAAGATGSAAVQSVRLSLAGITHCETDATVVVPAVMPIPLTAMADSTRARIRFITGPPSMMMIRFQTGSL